MDYTKQLLPQNYELRKLHEDSGHKLNNDFNILRQKDIMT